MECYTKSEMMVYAKNLEDDAILCPECWAPLAAKDKNVLYCPNEMCLNDEEYDKRGNSYS